MGWCLHPIWGVLKKIISHPPYLYLTPPHFPNPRNIPGPLFCRLYRISKQATVVAVSRRVGEKCLPRGQLTWKISVSLICSLLRAVLGWAHWRALFLPSWISGPVCRGFCRAMLCISAASAVVRCLSVTFVYCVKTAKTRLQYFCLYQSYNNNNTIIIIMQIFIVLLSWQSHCESSPGSFDECRTASSGCRLSDQAKRLGLWVRL